MVSRARLLAFCVAIIGIVTAQVFSIPSAAHTPCSTGLLVPSVIIEADMRCSFANAQLDGLIVNNVELHNVDFKGASLRNADFTDVRMLCSAKQIGGVQNSN